MLDDQSHSAYSSSDPGGGSHFNEPNNGNSGAAQALSREGPAYE